MCGQLRAPTWNRRESFLHQIQINFIQYVGWNVSFQQWADIFPILKGQIEIKFYTILNVRSVYTKICYFNNFQGLN
jgi:hypothetical protein